MGKFLIFCAAEFDALASPIGPEDYILAADGGLRHLQKLHVAPHGILGDFDSLGFVPEGACVFPVEKDDTDSMLAVRKGLELATGSSSSTALWTAPGWTTPWPISRPSSSWRTGARRGIWWAGSTPSPW